MRAEIVLGQLDLFGVGKVHVGQFLEHLSEIDGGVAVGDLDPAPYDRLSIEFLQLVSPAVAVFIRSVTLRDPALFLQAICSRCLTGRSHAEPRQGPAQRGASALDPSPIPDCWRPQEERRADKAPTRHAQHLSADGTDDPLAAKSSPPAPL